MGAPTAALPEEDVVAGRPLSAFQCCLSSLDTQGEGRAEDEAPCANLKWLWISPAFEGIAILHTYGVSSSRSECVIGSEEGMNLSGNEHLNTASHMLICVVICI